jgi:hypothetical protein
VSRTFRPQAPPPRLRTPVALTSEQARILCDLVRANRCEIVNGPTGSGTARPDRLRRFRNQRSLAIRLLLPPGSRLLELQEIRDRVGPLDKAALVYPWSSPDPRVDELQAECSESWSRPRRSRGISYSARSGRSRMPTRAADAVPAVVANRAARAELSEPWYRCARTDGPAARRPVTAHLLRRRVGSGVGYFFWPSWSSPS